MTVSDGRTDVLVVASSAPDLVGLRAHFGESLEGLVRGVVVRSKVVGFGAAVASAGVARGVAALAPRAVVLLGTCGVYPGIGDYRPYDVIVSTKVSALDHAALRGQSEWPTPMQTSVETSSALSSGVAAGRHRVFTAPIASPLATTVDDDLARSVVRGLGAHAESVDALGCACAAVSVNVPFVAVLGVSNVVGSTGARDWAQFRREAASQAANAIVAWVHAGAVGLPYSQLG